MLYPEVMKALPIAALVMALTGGVASADRVVVHGGGGGRTVVHEGNRGGVVVRGGGGVVVRGGGGGYRGGYGYHEGYRNNIYVNRPFIREHYYNRAFRPGLIVENYPVRDGYVWVRGSWSWDGGEWIWSPGFYQPVY